MIGITNSKIGSENNKSEQFYKWKLSNSVRIAIIIGVDNRL